MSQQTLSQRRFVRYAWGVVGYLVLVILWGAFVRATGSGAGCGAHWPLCNGDIVPQSPTMETIIELSHRLTSALAGFLIIGLVVWAVRAFEKGHPARRAAWFSLFFVITEGAIGAGIVLFEWVAHDTSTARIYSIAAHLVNTFILVAWLVRTAWWAQGHARPTWRVDGRWVAPALSVAGLVGLTLVVSTMGAVTALGDTLFKADSTAQVLGQALDSGAHPLQQLRVYHPLLATLLVGWTFVAIPRIQSAFAGVWVQRWGTVVVATGFAQLAIGLLNIWLKAPVWMQLVHLLLADVFWIGLILFASQALSHPARVRDTAVHHAVPA